MNMVKIMKGLGLCSIGFIGGSILTAHLILKFALKSERIKDGISEEIEHRIRKWIEGGDDDEEI